MITLRCRHCDRYLPLDIVATTITRIRCSDRRCKKWNNIKVILKDANDSQINYSFKEPI